jgi:hypothetical protein
LGAATFARSEDPVADHPSLDVDHTSCVFLGPEREKYTNEILMGLRGDAFQRSRLTQDVVMNLPSPRGPVRAGLPGSRTEQLLELDQMGLIDRHIYGELAKQGVAAAPRSTDAEFLRRVTLDLTGRIPTPDKVQQFLNDNSPDKRARLVDELLASGTWVDKWTMYFGDLYRNRRATGVMTTFEAGRDAFQKWIRDSLAANKPYSQMAREIIGATGTNSFEQGELNWLLLSDTSGGPAQDDYDQMAADTAETFLGLGHMNCILCHNGRGHLDSLSLWGKTAQRTTSWQFASYFGRTGFAATRPDPNNTNLRYYSLTDAGRTDYTLGTTTGNRPARTIPSSGVRTVTPDYPFDTSSTAPRPGEYRKALAEALVGDIQFSRATVNYLWAEFFSRGMVEPTNQFDPLRLDPDNPPPEPWKLQPTHPRLLNELAAEFQKNKHDLKWLMRTIVLSEAYQMSSRYEGTWNPSWETLFARKLVRRLWAEEIHDAVTQSSNLIPTYRLFRQGGVNYAERQTYDVRWAMQFPEHAGIPDGAGAVAQFLDAFLRGNRGEDLRRAEPSLLQALGMMNDTFVMNRIRSTGTGANASLLSRSLALDNDNLVTNLYLNVLSRYPSVDERSKALATLNGTTGTARTQRAENLLWTLYNKVDFLYNY